MDSDNADKVENKEVSRWKMKKFYEFKDTIDYEKADITATAVDDLNKFIENNPTTKIVSTKYFVIYVYEPSISYPMTSILVEVEE